MSNPDIGGISEDYYQISEAVLSSFPKYRLPLDLYRLEEKVVQLLPFYKKDSRLSNEQIEEMQNLLREGLLFVSRSDHPIYSKHIVKQLDLVLVDQNLKEAEVADIFIQAFVMRLEEFFEQPVKLVFENLREAAMVFTEYLWQDKHRIRLFMRRLNKDEHSLAKHSINSLIVGLWLILSTKGEELLRKELDGCALGFLLHDVGMSKIPSFILSKTTPLKPEEKDKIPGHVLAGAQIAQKMEIPGNEAQQICLEHHERMDGSGYPQRMKSDRISKLGGVAALADSFAAMIQKRPYAPAKAPLDAAKELSADARYDHQSAMALYTALVTGAFGKQGI